MNVEIELNKTVNKTNITFNYVIHSLLDTISLGPGEGRTLGTRGFSRVRWGFSVLAEGRHIFGRRTGNRARKVSGTQGMRGEERQLYSQAKVQ